MGEGGNPCLFSIVNVFPVTYQTSSLLRRYVNVVLVVLTFSRRGIAIAGRSPVVVDNVVVVLLPFLPLL